MHTVLVCAPPRCIGSYSLQCLTATGLRSSAVLQQSTGSNLVHTCLVKQCPAAAIGGDYRCQHCQQLVGQWSSCQALTSGMCGHAPLQSRESRSREAPSTHHATPDHKLKRLPALLSACIKHCTIIQGTGVVDSHKVPLFCRLCCMCPDCQCAGAEALPGRHSCCCRPAHSQPSQPYRNRSTIWLYAVSSYTRRRVAMMLLLL